MTYIQIIRDNIQRGAMTYPDGLVWLQCHGVRASVAIRALEGLER